MKKFLIVMMLLFAVATAHADIIWENDFDDCSDWQPTCMTCSSGYGGYSGGGDEDGTPEGWTYWRIDEHWNPGAPAPTVGSQPGLKISSANAYGGSGKALTVSNESEDSSPGDSGGWASDAILTKYLGQSYNEIYVRIMVKFQSGFKRHWTLVPSNLATIKMFRIVHWDANNSPYTFFEDGYTAPIANLFPDENEYGAGLARSGTRCDPQATAYYCSGDNYTVAKFVDGNCAEVTGWSDSDGGQIDSQLLGIWDNQWHTIVFHGKLNSATGVADGIFEIIYDGCQIKNLTNVQWIKAGGDLNAGFNTVHLGGNVYNNYLGITNDTYQAGAEQWYAIDNVVVATTYAEAAWPGATHRLGSKPLLP